MEQQQRGHATQHIQYMRTPSTPGQPSTNIASATMPNRPNFRAGPRPPSTDPTSMTRRLADPFVPPFAGSQASKSSGANKTATVQKNTEDSLEGIRELRKKLAGYKECMAL